MKTFNVKATGSWVRKSTVELEAKVVQLEANHRLGVALMEKAKARIAELEARLADYQDREYNNVKAEAKIVASGGIQESFGEVLGLLVGFDATPEMTEYGVALECTLSIKSDTNNKIRFYITPDDVSSVCQKLKLAVYQFL